MYTHNLISILLYNILSVYMYNFLHSFEIKFILFVKSNLENWFNLFLSVIEEGWQRKLCIYKIWDMERKPNLGLYNFFFFLITTIYFHKKYIKKKFRDVQNVTKYTI